MFVPDARNRIDNTTDGAVNDWIAALETIQPSRVHIYTLDRPPALGDLRPVAPRRLREIAERVRAIRILTNVFV